MIGSAITKQHPIETGHKHLPHTVLALSTTFYFDTPIEHLLDFMAVEKSSDQTATTKTRQVAARELLFYRDGFLAFTFCILLRYSLFHLLSASSPAVGQAL